MNRLLYLFLIICSIYLVNSESVFYRLCPKNVFQLDDGHRRDSVVDELIRSKSKLDNHYLTVDFVMKSVLGLLKEFEKIRQNDNQELILNRTLPDVYYDKQLLELFEWDAVEPPPNKHWPDIPQLMHVSLRFSYSFPINDRNYDLNDTTNCLNDLDKLPPYFKNNGKRNLINLLLN